MRIVTSIFDNIEGIYWFPIVALFIFLLLFVVMTIHTLSIKNSLTDIYGKMPLEADEKDQLNEQ